MNVPEVFSRLLLWLWLWLSCRFDDPGHHQIALPTRVYHAYKRRVGRPCHSAWGKTVPRHRPSASSFPPIIVITSLSLSFGLFYVVLLFCQPTTESFQSMEKRSTTSVLSKDHATMESFRSMHRYANPKHVFCSRLHQG